MPVASFRQVTLGAALAFLAGVPVTSLEQSWQQHEIQARLPASCPDYNGYAQKPHEPRTKGRLALPYMRPTKECRTFNSPAVEVSCPSPISNFPQLLASIEQPYPLLPMATIILIANFEPQQKVIKDVTSRIKDPDLARLFENTFPSTLDTTVKYFDPKVNLAFIITGVS